ncbi:MAG: lipocalin-like domain-containing protein [bacterium]
MEGSLRPRRARAPWVLPAMLAAVLAASLPLPARAQERERDPGEAGPPRSWSFPADHAAHPAFSTEWWYLTGHLEGARGDRFAVQAVFFRQALPRRPGAPEGWEPPVLYPAHLAVTDLREGTFTVEEVLGRELGGGAGAREDTLDVRTRGWSLRARPDGTWRLRAGRLDPDAGGTGLDLLLTPREGPLLHGEGGYSVKDPGAGQTAASWYYSIPRVGARGRLVRGGGEERVEGVLWFDHEFFSTGILTALEGWDWFGLRLDEGGSLMVARVRSGGREHLWGTWRGPDGEVRTLEEGEIRLEPRRWWTSPDGRARYPVAWYLEALPAGVEAVVSADLPASELRTERSVLTRYWEGSVRVRRAGAPEGAGRIGEGFLEMTGYAGPIHPPDGRPPGGSR